MLVTLLAAALAQAGAPAAAPESDPAWIAAKANKARMKTAPGYRAGPTDPTPPPEALAAGEHGRVVVAAIVGTDGKLRALRVAQSSRAPRLDALALERAAAWELTPALDAEGKPIEVTVGLPFDFFAGGTQEGKELQNYRCDQLVRDQDWWRKTWPEKPLDHFYVMTANMVALDASSREGAAITDNARAFPAVWEKTIAGCRAHPEAPAMAVFGPLWRRH